MLYPAEATGVKLRPEEGEGRVYVDEEEGVEEGEGAEGEVEGGSMPVVASTYEHYGGHKGRITYLTMVICPYLKLSTTTTSSSDDDKECTLPTFPANRSTTLAIFPISARSLL